MFKVMLSWTAVAVVIFALMVVCFAGTSLSPYKIGVVQTGSMSPNLPPRTLVIVKKHQIELGQPIMFTRQGAFVTHRWINTNDDGTLSTKGDANASVDPWMLDKADTIGGVVYSIPHLGFWVIFFQQWTSIASLALAGLCVWLLWPRPLDSDNEADVDVDEPIAATS